MKTGDRIPDLVLLRHDGSDVTLRQFLGEPGSGRLLLVVFLRHLA